MTPPESGRPDLSAPRRARLGAILLVALLHIAAVLALIRAFAPDFTARVAESVVATFTVTVDTPPPSPAPSPPATRASERAGAAAPAARKATPREVAAPAPKVVIATRPAPKVAGEGDDARSGNGDRGDGSGAGGAGSGTGAGNGGSGQGGGAASKPVKIAGDINSARDYPRAGRERRLGDYVILALAVGADGRVTGCRIYRPSRDPEADQITCRLATERFRFRPATDAAGKAASSTFGWRQRWYDPREMR